MKECNSDQIRNPKTLRCVLKRSVLGKKLLEKMRGSRRTSPRRTSPRRTSPRRTSPRRTSPRRTSPRRTSPRRVGRPRKITSPIKKEKPCNTDQIRNPKTRRCVLKRSVLGKKLLEQMRGSRRTSPRRVTSPRRTSPKKEKPCNSDQIRNPRTRRCVLKRSVLGKKILENMGKKRVSSPVRNYSPKRVSSPGKNNKDILTILNKDFAKKTIFDESYLNRVFGLLYLSHKYRNQCILFKPQKSYFESKIVDYNDYVYLKYQEKIKNFTAIDNDFWGKIKKCIDDKKRFIIIRIAIYFSYGAHANLLIYDTVNKTLERFEPHGSYHDYETTYTDLDDKIIKLFKDNLGKDSVKQYYKPLDYCPTVIFQALEKTSKKEGDPGGFCAVWCLWYADLRLANPDLSREKLIDKAIDRIKNEGGDFRQFIRNYSNFIAELRKKLKKSSDPEKELEKMFSSKKII